MFIVRTDEDSVYLMDNEDEIVMWTREEWEEDPSLVFSILEAVRIGYVHGPEEVRRIIP